LKFDVAIVAAILAAQRVFPAVELRRTVLLGELGLDGRLRPVRGILPATLAAQQAGFTRVIVPLRQAGERNWSRGSRSLVLARSPNWSPSCGAFHLPWWDSADGEDLKAFMELFIDAWLDPDRHEVTRHVARHLIVAHRRGTTIEAKIMLVHAASRGGRSGSPPLPRAGPPPES
jgi:hypothetical protein